MSRTKKKKKVSTGSVILAIISIFFAVIMLLPLIWGFFCSIQSESKQFPVVWDWFKPPYTFINYPNLIKGSSVFRWFLNSLWIAIVSTIVTLITATMAAYAIAKIPFRGAHGIYAYFMLGMLVPGEATIVPLFILVNNMHLIGTYAGLILPGIASAMTLIISVSFFRGLPEALMDAVRIDGGSEWTIYFKIVLPLSKPIISTVAMMTFIGSWNNYLWPLLCVFDDDMFTLPIGIPTLLSSQLLPTEVGSLQKQKTMERHQT